MKKIILIITLLLLGSCGTKSSNGITNKLVTPDYYYEIDTWGGNSEIYEITPKSNANKRCIIYLTDSIGSAAMQCFDKPFNTNI